MRIRLILLAFLLFIAMFVAAYIASTTRGYLDVSDLRNTGAGAVNVVGVIEDYVVEDGVLLVTLSGKDGSKVTLKISLELFTLTHGKPPGPWIIGKSIGVRGYYKPEGDGLRNLGIVEVTEILNPCHESYKSPPART